MSANRPRTPRSRFTAWCHGNCARNQATTWFDWSFVSPRKYHVRLARQWRSDRMLLTLPFSSDGQTKNTDRDRHTDKQTYIKTHTDRRALGQKRGKTDKTETESRGKRQLTRIKRHDGRQGRWCGGGVHCDACCCGGGWVVVWWCGCVLLFVLCCCCCSCCMLFVLCAVCVLGVVCVVLCVVYCVLFVSWVLCVLCVLCLLCLLCRWPPPFPSLEVAVIPLSRWPRHQGCPRHWEQHRRTALVKMGQDSCVQRLSLWQVKLPVHLEHYITWKKMYKNILSVFELVKNKNIEKEECIVSVFISFYVIFNHFENKLDWHWAMVNGGMTRDAFTPNRERDFSGKCVARASTSLLLFQNKERKKSKKLENINNNNDNVNRELKWKMKIKSKQRKNETQNEKAENDKIKKGKAKTKRKMTR